MPERMPARAQEKHQAAQCPAIDPEVAVDAFAGLWGAPLPKPSRSFYQALLRFCLNRHIQID